MGVKEVCVRIINFVVLEALTKIIMVVVKDKCKMTADFK